ncbi:MAG TPA: nuclear transport factor 2 family protein [Anaeromyxobacteraceae bacterium]|nr:nuclear transport factor 2 family protein [Anaeromyxobacteraceae bacterium]
MKSGSRAEHGCVEPRVRGKRSRAWRLIPAGATFATALAAWLWWSRVASCAALIQSPEEQIRKGLAGQDHARLDDVCGPHAGGTAELHSMRFDDISPMVEGSRATVAVMLTANGRVRWREGEARFAYSGRERFHMNPCSLGHWCSDGGQFDRLRGVLLALVRRRDALERGDVEAHAGLLSDHYRDRGEDRLAARHRLARELAQPLPRPRLLNWQIKIERETALVGEDAESSVQGEAPTRVRRVYRLERQGERWLFAGGV